MATKKKAKTTNRSTKVKAKPIPKKKKTPSKKKATKKVANPHVGKRYFMLEFGGYGGEFIVGRTTEEFVEYWLDETRDYNLDEHVMAMHEGSMSYSDDMLDEEENDEVTLDIPEGFDENSPEVSEGVKYIEYYELDDIEHDTVISKDSSQFTVTEIELHPKAVYEHGIVTWDSKECKKRNFDWSQEMYKVKSELFIDYPSGDVNTVYSTELFIRDSKKGLTDPVPVLMMYDGQKGTFGRLYVETVGEDFDVNKFAVSVCENNMTEHMSGFYYNKVQLNMDTNYLDTWGKGFNASVGYVDSNELSYDHEELLEEGWRYLEE